MFIFHINIDPAEVDVNVHPRKLAVKFLETQKVYRDILQAVEQALEGEISRGLGGQGEKMPGEQTAGEQGAMEFAGTQEKRTEGLEIQTVDANIIGQIANSYILIFDEEGLAIVDQHAAHERIMYEKFKAQMEKKALESQPLLAPISFELSALEAVFMERALDALTKIGFEFEQWSGNTLVINSCPPALQKENLEKIFRDFWMM